MVLHLVRHGAAGSRPYDHGDDLKRPLDQRGLVQAVDLVRHFEGVDLRAVWSSVATRCVDTVRPTAQAHGLEVDARRELLEGSKPAALIELMRSEAHNDGDILMCSHGDLIPEVINTLLRDGMSMIGQRGCEKGSVWTIETRGRDLVRATYVAQPNLSQPERHLPTLLHRQQTRSDSRSRSGSALRGDAEPG